MQRQGTIGWAVLLGYVVAYDYWACKSKKETLTQAFHRMANHPSSRPIVAAGSIIVVKHLALPRVYPRLDPINHLAERWRFEVDHVIDTISDAADAIEDGLRELGTLS